MVPAVGVDRYELLNDRCAVRTGLDRVSLYRSDRSFGDSTRKRETFGAFDFSSKTGKQGTGNRKTLRAPDGDGPPPRAPPTSLGKKEEKKEKKEKEGKKHCAGDALKSFFAENYAGDRLAARLVGVRVIRMPNDTHPNDIYIYIYIPTMQSERLVGFAFSPLKRTLWRTFSGGGGWARVAGRSAVSGV